MKTKSAYRLIRKGSRNLAIALVTLLAAHAAQGATLTWGMSTVVPSDWTAVSGGAAVCGYSPNVGIGAAVSNTNSAFSFDNGQLQNMIFSTPTFELDASGDLTFKLAGQGGGGSNPANISDIPINGAPFGGFMGVGLRDVATGAYVLTQRGGGSGNHASYSFTAAQLASYVGNGKIYTLDLIDTFNGGWGWTSLKDVAVPGFLSTGQPAMAWNAGAGGNWSDAAWTNSPPTSPDGTRQAVIDTGYTVAVDGAQTVQQLALSNQGKLSIASGNSLTVKGSLTAAAVSSGSAVTMAGSTLSVQSGTIDSLSVSGGVAINVTSTGGTLAVPNYSADAASVLTKGGTGTLALTNAGGSTDPLGANTTQVILNGGKLSLSGQVSTTTNALKASYYTGLGDARGYIEFGSGYDLRLQTPVATATETGAIWYRSNGSEGKKYWSDLFAGQSNVGQFDVMWQGQYKPTTTSNKILGTWESDRDWEGYVKIDGSWQRWRDSWRTLDAANWYDMAITYKNNADDYGSIRIPMHQSYQDWTGLDVSSGNSFGQFRFQTLGTVDMSGKTVQVTANSELAVATDSPLSVGALTLTSGVLTVSGAPSTTFASTTIDALATSVGINSAASVALGAITGNDATATFIKAGAGTLTLNAGDTGLSNITFDVQAGKLSALSATALGGAANVQLSGGQLLLSGNTAFGLNLNVTQSSTLTAGAGGSGFPSVTLGAPSNTLTIRNGKTLTVNTDSYGLTIKSGLVLEDNAIMTVTGGVEIQNKGAASLTMGTGSTINLNASTTSLTTDKALVVYNLNLAGGSLVQTGSGADKNLTVNGTLTLNNSDTNLNLSDATLATASDATLNLVNGTITSDKALTVGNLTVESGATLNLTGTGADRDIIVSGKLRLVNKTLDTTGSALSVGNRIELDGSSLTSGNALTVNTLWMNNSTIASPALTVNGTIELYGSSSANYTGVGKTLSVGGIRMDNNATLTYDKAMTVNGTIEIYGSAKADFTGVTLTTNWQSLYINGNTAELKAAGNLNLNYLEMQNGAKLSAPSVTLNDRAYFRSVDGRNGNNIENFSILENPANPGRYIDIYGGGYDRNPWDGSMDIYFNGTNTYTGYTAIHDNTVLVANDGVGMPSGSRLSFQNGVWGASGTINRTISNAAGNNVSWDGAGGFAAYGGDLSVALATTDGSIVTPNAQLTWSSYTQGFNNQTLYLGSSQATNNVTLTNAIEINSDAPINTQGRNTLATLSGNLTGGSTLVKQGPGTLVLGGSNSGFTGTTRIDKGVLEVGNNGAGLGAGWLQFNADNADSWNGGAILQGKGTLAKSTGWGTAGSIGWESNGGGFAARGGPLNVTLATGVMGTQVVWSSNTAGFNNKNLMFGSSTADNVVTLTNNIDFENGYRSIYAFDNPNSVNDKAVLSGTMVNVQGLEKQGNGILEMNGFVTSGNQVANYGGGTLKINGNLRSGDEYVDTDPRYIGTSDRDVRNDQGSKLIVTGNIQANYMLGGDQPASSLNVAGNVTLRNVYEQNGGTANIGGNLQMGDNNMWIRNTTTLVVGGDLTVGAPSGTGADRSLYLQAGADLTVNGTLRTASIEAQWGRNSNDRGSSLHINGTANIGSAGNANMYFNADNATTGGGLDGTGIVNANNVGFDNKAILGGTLTMNIRDQVWLSSNSVMSPGGAGVGTMAINRVDGSGGNLTLNNSTIYAFGGGDLVRVGGQLTLNDNWTLDVLATGQPLAAGGSMKLFTYGTMGTFDATPSYDITALITAGWLPGGFDTGTLSLSAVDGSVFLNGLSILPPIWSGVGGDNKWQTLANWGALKPAAGSPLQFAGANTSNSNDFSAGTSFTGIQFNAGASTFTLAGNSINMDGDIVNNSSNPQNLHLPMVLSSVINIDTKAQPMSIGGSGAVISGDGGLRKIGSGMLTLTGTNTYAGHTSVNEGTLQASGTLSSGLVSVASAAHLAVGPNATTVGALELPALTLATGSITDFKFGSSTNDLINVTGAGGLTIDTGAGINLFSAASGRTAALDSFGTFNLFQYTGTDPAYGNLSILNPVAGNQYSIGLDGGNVAVTISGYIKWNGGASGNWGDSTWTHTSSFPGAADPAKIDTPYTVTVDGTRSAAELLVSNEGNLNITAGNGLTVSGNLSVAAVTAGSGVTMANNSTLAAASGSVASLHATGNVTINATSGSLNIQSYTTTGASTLTKGGVGVLALQGAKPIGDSTSVTLNGGELKLSVGGTSVPTSPVAGMSAWFDASYGVTTSGTQVTSWADRSGNGHTADGIGNTSTLASSQINGLPSVQFRNSWLDIQNNMTVGSEYIVFKSGRYSYDPGNPNQFGPNWSAPFGRTDGGGWMEQAGTQQLWDGNKPSAVSQNGTAATLNGNNWQLTNVGQYMVLKVDPSSIAEALYTLGRNGGYTNGYTDVAEVISYDHVLSTSDENYVGTYLANKYGISTDYNAQVVGTSGSLDMSTTNVGVTADSVLNASTDASASFGALTITSGVVTAKGSPSGISFTSTAVAAAATGGVNASVPVTLGALTLGNGATFSTAGSVTTTSTALTGAAGTINATNTFNLGTYSDGGATKTLTLGGTGTKVLDNSGNGIVASNTTLRITGGIVDTTATAVGSNDPLGGAMAIQLAGGKLTMAGLTTITNNAMKAMLYNQAPDNNLMESPNSSNSLYNKTAVQTVTQSSGSLFYGSYPDRPWGGTNEWTSLFPGLDEHNSFEAMWKADFTPTYTESYHINSAGADDNWRSWIKISGNWEEFSNNWRSLTAGTKYEVVTLYGNWSGDGYTGPQLQSNNHGGEWLATTSPKGLGSWSMTTVGALNMTGRTVQVDASSEISATSDFAVTYGALTVNNGVLSLSGTAPSTSFASTTINAAATLVGLNSGGTVDAGVISGNSATGTFVKGGAGSLTLNAGNTGLSNMLIDVQGGSLVASSQESLGGSASVQLSGGSLRLSKGLSGGAAYDLTLNVTENATLTAGKTVDGVSFPSITLGSAAKTLTIQNGKTLTVNTSDSFGLTINDSLALQDSATLNVNGQTAINIIGAATLTMGNSSTLNLNASTTSLTTDKALSVYNLNVLNSATLVQTGTGHAKDIYVGGTFTLNSSATNLDLTGATLTTASNATLNLVNGSITTEKALNVGNLTVESDATLNRTGTGANGDVTVGTNLRLVNKTFDTTGSTLSVGNRIELDNSSLTSGNALTVNQLSMNNNSSINSSTALTVNGEMDVYNGSANFTGKTLSVGNVRLSNGTLTYNNPQTLSSLWSNGTSTLNAGANTTINGGIELYNNTKADFSGVTLAAPNWGALYVHGNSQLKLQAGSTLNVNYVQVWDGQNTNSPLSGAGANVVFRDRLQLMRGIYDVNFVAETDNTDRRLYIWNDGEHVFTGTNSWKGVSELAGGENSVMVANEGVGMPATSRVSFQDGIWGASGTVTRTISNNNGANVAWNGAGGFAGYGADLSVSLTTSGGANAPLTWNSYTEGFNSQILYLGSTYATSNVSLTNAININSYAQIRTNSRTTLATLTGNLTGDQTLDKQGLGTLVLTGDNSGFSGRNYIRRGALDVGNLTTGTSLGSGRVDLQADTGDQNQKGAILQGYGTLAKTIGSAAGNVRWDDNGGGFAARGGALNVTLTTGVIGTQVLWGSDTAGFNGRNLMFGSGTADNVVTLTNNIDGQNGDRSIYVFDNPNTANDKAVLSGTVVNLSGFSKLGDGVLEMNAFVTDTTNVRNNGGGTLKVSGDMRVGAAYDNPGDTRGDGGANSNFENNDNSKLIVTGNVRANYFYGGGQATSSVNVTGDVTLRDRYEQNGGTSVIGGTLNEGEQMNLRNGTVMTVGNLRVGAPSGAGSDRNLYIESGADLTVSGTMKANYVQVNGQYNNHASSLHVNGVANFNDRIYFNADNPTNGGGVLDGSGTINTNYVEFHNKATLGGTLTVNVTNKVEIMGDNGILAPGGTGIGTLTIGGTSGLLQLNGGSFSNFDIASTTSYDKAVSTSVSLGGTLTVSGSIPGAVNIYNLFSAGSYSGDFGTVNLPTAPTGYAWHAYGANDYFDETTGQIQLDASGLIIGNNSKLWVGSTEPTGSLQTTSVTQAFGRVLTGSTHSANITLNSNGSDAATTNATVVATGTGISTTTTSPGLIGALTSSGINATLDTATVGGKSGAVTITNQATGSAGASQGSDNGTATLNVTGTVVDQRSFNVGTPTLALGTIHAGTVAAGTTTAISSAGLNAVTGNASLGSFGGTNTGSLTLTTSDATAFNGGTSSQTATYTLSGTIAAGNLSSASFSSTVSAELGSISNVGVTVTGSATNGLATWTASGNGNWSANADWTDTASVNAAPGTFGASYAGVDTATFVGAAGSHTVTVDTDVNLNALTFTGTGSYILAGSNSLTLAGTTPVITSAGTQSINAPLTLAANAAVDVTAGTLTIGGNITAVGSQTLTKNGAGALALTGTNSYSGNTHVAVGTLYINGANTGLGTVTVDATLGGTGTIAGPVNVTSTGILSPGVGSIESLASGALTFTSGSHFAYQATNSSATGADLMVVTGNLALGSATLDLTGLNGAWTGGTTLTMLSYTGSLTGTFSSYADDTSYLFGSNYWMLNYNAPLAAKGANFAADVPSSGAQLVTVTMDAYYTWAAAKGLTHGVNDGPTQDADNDGATNLAEFAFDGNPRSAADKGKVYAMQADSDYSGDPSVAKELILTVAVRTDTPTFAGATSPTATSTVDAVSYTIEGSTTMKTDASAGAFGTVVVHPVTAITTNLPTPTTGYKYVSFSLEGSNGLAGKGFLRAKAVK